MPARNNISASIYRNQRNDYIMCCADLKSSKMASNSSEANHFQRLLRIVSQDGHGSVLIATERVLLWVSREEPADDKNRGIFRNNAMNEARYEQGAAILTK